MNTSWADEEDRVNAKYDSIHDKRKTTRAATTITRIKRVATTTIMTTTQALTTSASQTTLSRLYNILRKITPRRTLAASETCSKKSVSGIWKAITQTISATSSGEHSRISLSHDTLTIKRAKRKSTKAMTTSKNLKRW
jgi:hypothetical protein